MKRKISGLCALLALCLCGNAGALSAQAAIVIDGTTGETLFAQNADERLPMASTTKIATAITAIELGDLDKTYAVKPEYTAVEGSSMYLKTGERITLRETLYGLLLMSGNDAATALAGECGGQEAFVALMNETARKLGLTDTHFDNPSGLDGDTHYTTARELAKLTAYALQDETFREIVSTKSLATDARYMTNHNKLLRLYDGAIGVKTGYTKRSGRCLVSAAERNGRTLIAVTLNDPDDWGDHMAMLDDAFALYAPYTLHEARQAVALQTVEGGNSPSVALLAEGGCFLYLTEKERAELQTRLIGAHFSYAPVSQGASYGKIQYLLGDTVMGEDSLRYAQSVLLPARKRTWWARLFGD